MKPIVNQAHHKVHDDTLTQNRLVAAMDSNVNVATVEFAHIGSRSSASAITNVDLPSSTVVLPRNCEQWATAASLIDAKYQIAMHRLVDCPTLRAAEDDDCRDNTSEQDRNKICGKDDRNEPAARRKQEAALSWASSSSRTPSHSDGVRGQAKLQDERAVYTPSIVDVKYRIATIRTLAGRNSPPHAPVLPRSTTSVTPVFTESTPPEILTMAHPVEEEVYPVEEEADDIDYMEGGRIQQSVVDGIIVKTTKSQSIEWVVILLAMLLVAAALFVAGILLQQRVPVFTLNPDETPAISPHYGGMTGSNTTKPVTSKQERHNETWAAQIGDNGATKWSNETGATKVDNAPATNGNFENGPAIHDSTAVTGGNLDSESDSTLSPVAMTTERYFTTTQQLYDAVDAYIEALYFGADDITESVVAVQYGYPIAKWDVSRLTNFSRVFDPDRGQRFDPYRYDDRSLFEDDLGGWDMSNATTLEGMFSSATSFTGMGLDQWNVEKVMNFAFVFARAFAFNGNVSGWNTSKATTMEGMFMGAQLFSGDVSRFDVAHVKSMSFMFAYTERFNGGALTSWNVAQVEDMAHLFGGASAFQGNVSTWDTRRVTDMSWMFSSTKFKGDVSRWKVHNVQTMASMFYGAEMFNSNLSSWKVLSLVHATEMFHGASDFNQNLCIWHDVIPMMAEVSMMLYATGCPDTSNPVLDKQTLLSFCTYC